MLRKRKRRKSTFLPERSERGSVEREYEERRKGLVLLTRKRIRILGTRDSCSSLCCGIYGRLIESTAEIYNMKKKLIKNTI
jgi:hypothetical protein